MLKPFLCFIVAVCLTLSACGVFDRSEEEIVIMVGERTINETELKKDIMYITSGMGLTEQAVKEVLDSLIVKLVDHYLVLEYGRQNNITISKKELDSALEAIKKDYPEEKVFREMLLNRYLDYEEWKEGLRQQLLVRKIIAEVYKGISPVTPDEIRAYYDSHGPEFVHPSMVELHQIVTNREEEAEALWERLQKGESFDELAREYSTAPEAEDGGEVGWISKDELDESIDKVIFSLAVGGISPVVKTPYGYHLFQVQSKRPEGSESLEEAWNEIEAKLVQQRQEVLYNNWIARLRELFPVKINHELVATLELG
jgi:parvulin-like peptidyl-prolyl isomerase